MGATSAFLAVLCLVGGALAQPCFECDADEFCRQAFFEEFGVTQTVENEAECGVANCTADCDDPSACPFRFCADDSCCLFQNGSQWLTGDINITVFETFDDLCVGPLCLERRRVDVQEDFVVEAGGFNQLNIDNATLHDGYSFFSSTGVGTIIGVNHVVDAANLVMESSLTWRHVRAPTLGSTVFILPAGSPTNLTVGSTVIGITKTVPSCGVIAVDSIGVPDGYVETGGVRHTAVFTPFDFDATDGEVEFDLGSTTADEFALNLAISINNVSSSLGLDIEAHMSGVASPYTVVVCDVSGAKLALFVHNSLTNVDPLWDVTTTDGDTDACGSDVFSEVLIAIPGGATTVAVNGIDFLDSVGGDVNPHDDGSVDVDFAAGTAIANAAAVSALLNANSGTLLAWRDMTATPNGAGSISFTHSRGTNGIPIENPIASVVGALSDGVTCGNNAVGMSGHAEGFLTVAGASFSCFFTDIQVSGDLVEVVNSTFAKKAYAPTNESGVAIGVDNTTHVLIANNSVTGEVNAAIGLVGPFFVAQGMVTVVGPADGVFVDLIVTDNAVEGGNALPVDAVAASTGFAFRNVTAVSIATLRIAGNTAPNSANLEHGMVFNRFNETLHLQNLPLFFGSPLSTDVSDEQRFLRETALLNPLALGNPASTGGGNDLFDLSAAVPCDNLCPLDSFTEGGNLNATANAFLFVSCSLVKLRTTEDQFGGRTSTYRLEVKKDFNADEAVTIHFGPSYQDELDPDDGFVHPPNRILRETGTCDSRTTASVGGPPTWADIWDLGFSPTTYRYPAEQGWASSPFDPAVGSNYPNGRAAFSLDFKLTDLVPCTDRDGGAASTVLVAQNEGPGVTFQNASRRLLVTIWSTAVRPISTTIEGSGEIMASEAQCVMQITETLEGGTAAAITTLTVSDLFFAFDVISIFFNETTGELCFILETFTEHELLDQFGFPTTYLDEERIDPENDPFMMEIQPFINSSMRCTGNNPAGPFSNSTLFCHQTWLTCSVGKANVTKFNDTQCFVWQPVIANDASPDPDPVLNPTNFTGCVNVDVDRPDDQNVTGNFTIQFDLLLTLYDMPAMTEGADERAAYIDNERVWGLAQIDVSEAAGDLWNQTIQRIRVCATTTTLTPPDPPDTNDLGNTGCSTPGLGLVTVLVYDRADVPGSHASSWAGHVDTDGTGNQENVNQGITGDYPPSGQATWQIRDNRWSMVAHPFSDDSVLIYVEVVSTILRAEGVGPTFKRDARDVRDEPADLQAFDLIGWQAFQPAARPRRDVPVPSPPGTMDDLAAITTMVVLCPNGTTFDSIGLNCTAANVTVSVNISLLTFEDADLLVPRNMFEDGETVYGLVDLIIPAGDDPTEWFLTLQDVWLCASVSDNTALNDPHPDYPTRTTTGCFKANVTDIELQVLLSTVPALNDIGRAHPWAFHQDSFEDLVLEAGGNASLVPLEDQTQIRIAFTARTFDDGTTSVPVFIEVSAVVENRPVELVENSRKREPDFQVVVIAFPLQFLIEPITVVCPGGFDFAAILAFGERCFDAACFACGDNTLWHTVLVTLATIIFAILVVGALLRKPSWQRAVIRGVPKVPGHRGQHQHQHHHEYGLRSQRVEKNA